MSLTSFPIPPNNRAMNGVSRKPSFLPVQESAAQVVGVGRSRGMSQSSGATRGDADDEDDESVASSVNRRFFEPEDPSRSRQRQGQYSRISLLPSVAKSDVDLQDSDIEDLDIHTSRRISRRVSPHPRIVALDQASLPSLTSHKLQNISSSSLASANHNTSRASSAASGLEPFTNAPGIEIPGSQSNTQAQSHSAEMISLFEKRAVGASSSEARSALSKMLASADDVEDDNPFKPLYISVGLQTGRSVQISYEFARDPQQIVELKVREDASVEEVIGYGLFMYLNQNIEPNLSTVMTNSGQMTAAQCNLRIVEDGEIDEDFPRELSCSSFLEDL